MSTICWRRGRLAFCEIWFDAPDESHDCDVVFYRQAFAPVARARCSFTHTYEIDLSLPHDQLFASLKGDTRTRIRQAERDGAVYESLDQASIAECLGPLCDSFDQMAIAKGLSPIDRDYVQACHQAGVLDVSRVLLASGEVAVWHSYIVTRGRASLFTTVSHFREDTNAAHRNAIGRANRLAHWRDIARFQEAGYIAYDFGGWYTGSSDTELLNINRFKREFGGSVVQRYNCTSGRTPRGRLFVAVRSAAQSRIITPSARKWARRAVLALSGTYSRGRRA